jgi:1-acyl-sn-glycerol-3-phosphate acyltransferase
MISLIYQSIGVVQLVLFAFTLLPWRAGRPWHRLTLSRVNDAQLFASTLLPLVYMLCSSAGSLPLIGTLVFSALGTLVHRMVRFKMHAPVQLDAGERVANVNAAVDYQPVPRWLYWLISWPFRLFYRSSVVGIERVPPVGPVLVVGNHALYGLDMPAVFAALRLDSAISVRGLTDHAHMAVPSWAAWLRLFGAVDGNRDVAKALLERGRHVLVYPGGAREVLTPGYELQWGDRLGFATCARAASGTRVVPVATCGIDELFGVCASVPVDLVLGRRLSAPVLVPPLNPRRWQRLYFEFGEPIDADQFDSDEALRDRVKQALEALIVSVRQRQASDPHRYHLRR